jgi:hypothetical protein
VPLSITRVAITHTQSTRCRAHARTPPQDGYALMMSARSSRVGCGALDAAMLSMLEGRGVPVRAPFAFTKSAGGDGSVVSRGVEAHGLAPSYTRYHTLEVVRGAREAVCRVNPTPLGAGDSGAGGAGGGPPPPYELPDGTLLAADEEQCRVPELLFDPSPLVATLPGAAPLQRMVAEALVHPDMELRRDLAASIILTGGGACTPGISERVQAEVAAIAPAVRARGVL